MPSCCPHLLLPPQDAKRNALRANGLCWMACGGMHLYNAGTGVQVGVLVTLWSGLRVGAVCSVVVFASLDKLSGALYKLNGARGTSAV